MLIGEVAAHSGVTAKTLRYYEDIRVIDAPARSPAGYRLYGEDVLQRLEFIRSAQALGLSLGEIRGIVALRDDGETPCGHVLDLLRVRSREVAKTIRQLRAIDAELKALVARAKSLDPAQCDPTRVCHLIGSV